MSLKVSHTTYPDMILSPVELVAYHQRVNKRILPLIQERPKTTSVPKEELDVKEQLAMNFKR
jgi:hypothetical protein